MKRFYFLDNLRVAVIILVILHHIGQAYGPTGGWWPVQETTRTAILGPFFAVNRSFSMSIFFLISGYFTVMFYDAKGSTAFIKSRILRLGLPVLFFGLSMIPLQLFVFSPQEGRKPSVWPVDIGHLWFLEHLIVYSLCYALIRMIYKDTKETGAVEPPGNLAIILFALGLAIISAIVRIWYPIDKWVYLLGFIRVSFADVPRDLSFFLIGILSYRNQWIAKFPTRNGYIWFSIGVLLAVLWYLYVIVLRDRFPINGITLGILYPVWESLLCCGMCIGLTILFRERFDHQGRIKKMMAQSQYSVYIFHVPIVILFQLLILGFNIPPLAKFVLVALVSIPVTFVFSNWVRKPLHL